MKRLIKKASSVTVYHGTSLKRLKEISQSGALIPQALEGGGWVSGKESDFTGHVFFATTMEKATRYANGIYTMDGETDNAPVVIELSLSEDMLLPDKGDAYWADDWKESADSCQQVQVAGNVSDSYFTIIHFINNGAEIPYNRWQSYYENNIKKEEN